MSPAKLTEITLESVGRGAAVQLFAREFEKVLQNIQDPNTDPEEVRQISITVKVKPNKNRDEAQARVAVTSKLASFRPVEERMFMGEQDGQLVAVAFDPKQGDMFHSDGDRKVTPIARKDAANQ